MPVVTVDLKMPVEEFLGEYWQKKPLFVKKAVSFPADLMSGEELAGLALEEGTESRLIYRQKDGKPWVSECGPFSSATFTNLPEFDWSLLVQDVDKFLPEVAEFKNSFRFIPDWRLDDVMISYSPKGGGAGPHMDLYDVFLIQGSGRRRWHIEDRRCLMDEEPYIENADLRIMQKFNASRSWDMEHGDLLYLPPGFPHQGESLCPSVTFSVGFRSPSREELLSGFSDYLRKGLTEDDRYEDPDLPLQAHPAEISRSAIRKIRSMLTEQINEPGALEHWLGCRLTELKGGNESGFRPEPPEEKPDEASFLELISRFQWFCRDEGSQIVWIQDSEEHLQLFVNGAGYLLHTQCFPWIRLISGNYRIPCDSLLAMIRQFPECGKFLYRLYCEGIFYGDGKSDP